MTAPRCTVLDYLDFLAATPRQVRAVVPLEGFGLVKVFRIEAPNGDTE